MKLTVIIAEYNPLHSGHIYHIGEAKKLGNPVVAIQSGAFVQRGEVAILDKYERALSAVKNGVDVVFELPAPFAFAPADKFTLGAFKLIKNINADIILSFGSECGNIELIEQTANILLSEPTPFKLLLKENLSNGMSFNKARSEALNAFAKENNIAVCNISEPNNILAVEYAKLNQSLGNPFKLHSIQRLGNYKGGNIGTTYKSASEIRELFKNSLSIAEDLIPNETAEFLKKHPYTNNDIIYIYSVLNMAKNNIANIFDIKEGLENKIYQESQNATTAKELVANIVNARYTESRIRRILTNVLLNVTKDKFDECINEAPLFNLLSANKEQRNILSSVNEHLYTSQNGLLNSPLYQAQLTHLSQALFKVLRGYSNDYALFI